MKIDQAQALHAKLFSVTARILLVSHSTILLMSHSTEQPLQPQLRQLQQQQL